MNVVNVFIVPGLVIGCIYAIAASGLVMAYTTSGVLNLGYGAMAYTIALIFYELHTSHRILGGWAALALCAVIIGPLMGVLMWHGLFRWLAGLGYLPGLVATIGLAIALPALCQMIFNPQQIFYAPAVAAQGQNLHKIGPFVLSVDQIYGVGAAVVVAVLLFCLLRFTVTGLKMRAVFDSSLVASLTGTSPGASSSLSWALSGALAAIGGIFLAPLLTLDPTVFISLTVASLAAALIGGLRSVSVAFVAALLIGVVSSALTGIDQTSTLLTQGVQPSLPFLVMAGAVLLRRRPIVSGQPPRRALEPPERLERLQLDFMKAAPVGLVILIVPLVLSSYWTGVISLGLIYSIIFLGFTFALGYGGLLPLGQAALVGIGGFVAGHLATTSGVPLLVAIVLGGCVAAVAGGILAAIGRRLNALEFGLLTLAFGLFADNFLFNWSTLVNPLYGWNFGNPSIFGLSLAGTVRQYYLFAVILAIVLGGVAWYRRRVGSFYVSAGRMNAELTQASGVDPRTGRAIAFVVAAGLAGIGGGLLGVFQNNLAPQDVTTTTGLVWLALIVFTGIRSPIGAIVAGLTYSILPALLAQWLPIRLGPLSTVMFGVGALVLAQDPRGMVSAQRDQIRYVANLTRTRFVRREAI
jgi:branched-chain amino acid transport system permease protein